MTDSCLFAVLDIAMAAVRFRREDLADSQKPKTNWNRDNADCMGV